MYETYWGLSESPFRNRIDGRWYYESSTHEEALARLCFLIEQRRRCGLLIGSEGTGKSFLLHVLTTQLQRTQRQTAVVDLLGLGSDEMLWHLAASLQLDPDDAGSSLRLWRTVHDRLAGLQRSGRQTVLIFDHLDRAGSDCLRTLERLLQSSESPDCRLTVIVATRATAVRKTSPMLAEFTDLRAELSPLDWYQTVHYVSESLKKVGCDRELFDLPALESLFAQTGGVPRAINRLCDLSLLAAMGGDRSGVDQETVNSAAGELRCFPQIHNDPPPAVRGFG